MRLQAITNVENAQFSTGPKTEAGKAIASMNALTHGLTSNAPLLPGEDAEALAALAAALQQEYKPVGEVERGVVEAITLLVWKQPRYDKAEAEFLARGKRLESEAKSAGVDLTASVASSSATPLADAFIEYQKELALVLRYSNSNASKLDRQRKELRLLQAERRQGQAVQAAQAVAPAIQPHTAAAAATDADATDWLDVVQSLYNAVSAGPQSPHPLPENYHGSYAIWLKQQLMVEQDIGDDEAGSQLVATMVALKMRLANVAPKPGVVWGSPAEIAAWREAVKTKNPYPKWCELVRREYGRRGRKARMKQEG